MKYPVKDIPAKKRVISEYPELIRVIEGVNLSASAIKDVDKLLRYVILMFSMDSPLIEYYPDYLKRVQYACKLLKISSKSIQEENTYLPLETITYRYFKFTNNAKWETYCSIESRLSFVLQGVRNAREDDSLKQHSEAMELASKALEMQDKIDMIKHELFGDYEELAAIIARNSTDNLDGGFAEHYARERIVDGVA